MKKIVIVAMFAATISALLGCTTAGTGTATPFTTTVTSTVRVTTTPDENFLKLTVRQAIAENGATPWLQRLDAAGLGDWPVGVATNRAWTICDQITVGGDYDKIIDKLSMFEPRAQIVGVYRAAVGFLCDQPLGAPPGMP